MCCWCRHPAVVVKAIFIYLIDILADTSIPDKSVEEEFCRKNGRDNYRIINYEKEE